jgi:hypothetical protein
MEGHATLAPEALKTFHETRPGGPTAPVCVTVIAAANSAFFDVTSGVTFVICMLDAISLPPDPEPPEPPEPVLPVLPLPPVFPVFPVFPLTVVVVVVVGGTVVVVVVVPLGLVVVVVPLPMPEPGPKSLTNAAKLLGLELWLSRLDPYSQ